MQHFKEVGLIPYEDGMSWKHRFRIDIPDELPEAVQKDIQDAFDKQVEDWFEKTPDATLADVSACNEANSELLLNKMQAYVAEAMGVSRQESDKVADPFTAPGPQQPELRNANELEHS
ncbi:hypothetical protein ACGYLO_12510 [Sulfitobacter sp. 1A13353]|uniref:hypothetical protein n=1 Tax=Sulfitobacter sp. 1A13353 TaxID=3368568 RepID=UPI003745F48E